MKQRYFIELMYDGTAYHGWQIQPNSSTVQEQINLSLSTVLGEEINVVGAGRTDTAVHAKQMFAHFDSAVEFGMDELVFKLNSYLKNDISIVRVFKVGDSAHSRFDAISRKYEYIIHKNKNPFLINKAWHFHKNLDIDAMNEAEMIVPDAKYINDVFEDVNLDKKYDNIVLTHVLEHLDDPVKVLKRINDEWLSDNGRFFLVTPNAMAPSRQIAVKMGLISHNSAVTPAEEEHGHRITYTLDTLERDARAAGLKVVHRSGIFFKALANFQWDNLLMTDIISKDYLDGCYELGHQYPELCSSIFLMCEKG